MGISSNQARLMTLTARQHDLELRAQQISAEKMIKSLNSQRWAMEYSEKLNLFTQQKQGLQPTYLKEVQLRATKGWVDEKGYLVLTTDYRANDVYFYDSTALVDVSPMISIYNRIEADTNTPTRQDVYQYLNANSAVWNSIIDAYVQNFGRSVQELSLTYAVQQAYFQPYYVSPNADGTCASVKIWNPAYSTDPSTAIDIDPTILQQMTGYAGNSGTRYMDVFVTERPTEVIEVPYDELDINVIKAEYDAAVSSLTADEKLLDMELTQINTEHKAVKTEYDSVKSLIGENVDKSFNVFG